MKKLYFKFLFFKHNIMQFVGLKHFDNDIIKIWRDKETQDVCMFTYGRSGLFYTPVGRRCEENKRFYSYWLASFNHMEKYGVLDNKKNKTIYTLDSIKEEH